MSMWTAIVIIVMAAMAGQAWRHHVTSRGSNTREEAIDKLEARVDELENDLRHRVQTLERIVTDDRNDLKRKFDHLDKAS